MWPIEWHHLPVTSSDVEGHVCCL